MTPHKFLIQLSIISGLVALVLMVFHTYAIFAPHQSLSWISWGFFILFSLGVFLVGTKGAKSSNQHLFGQIFLVATGLKMLVSVTIILIYFLKNKPEDQYFILPFFAIYLVYTSFEVFFMTKLGKTESMDIS
ncbi:MAG: hypothetical protein GY810_13870 [Aureispira sp.]|nr:hypothetical protein [Aureispira sp.]